MSYSTPQKVAIVAFSLSFGIFTRFAWAEGGGGSIPPDKAHHSEADRYLLAKAAYSGHWEEDPPGHAPRFEYKPDLFPSTTDSGTLPQHTATILEEWRAYVDEKMDRYRALIVPDYSFCRSLPCNPDPNQLSEEYKLIQGELLKETGNFIRTKATWIDSVVKYSRVDIVYNAERDITLNSVADRGPLDTSAVRPRKKEVPFSFNGGFRTSIAGGTVGLVAEARARYYTLTSFYRFDFAKHNNVIGMEYPLRANMLMQFRAESSYSVTEASAGMIIQNNASVQLLNLIYQF